MDNKIDEKKLAAAKEKLACHILPPDHAAKEELSPFQAAVAAASGGTEQESFIDADGKVYLTRMTAAGG